MQITLEIPDELVLQMDARGTTPQDLAIRWMHDALATLPTVEEIAPERRNLDAFFREMRRHSDKIPHMAHLTFNRDELYEDHD